MAWVHCALSSFPPSTYTVTAKKTLDSASSLPPLKLTKRKNYLRTKLLKTLTKPYHSPLLPHENTEEEQLLRKLSETLEIQQEEEFVTGDFSGSDPILAEEEEEEVKNEQAELDSYSIQVSSNAVAGVSDVPGVFSTRSVLEIVLYLVGIFVLQTVCAVWIFGSGNLNKKSGNEEKEADLGVLRSGMVNGKKNGDFLSNLMGNVSGNIIGSKPGGLINVDDNALLKENILRIRAMAREARESEAKKLSSNGLGSSSDIIGVDGDENIPKLAISKVKTNIRKEVDGRLSKLEKRLRSVRENPTALSVSYLRSSSKVEYKKDVESSNGKVKDDKLMFKKKKKFRSYPKHPENHPKGFQGGKDFDMPSTTATQDASYASNNNGRDVLDLLTQEKQDDVQPLNSDSGVLRGSEEEKNYHWSGDTLEEPKPKMQENEEVERKLSGNEVRSSQALGATSRKGEKPERVTGMRSDNAKPRSGVIQETSQELVDLRKSRESKTNISRTFTKQVEHGPRNNSLKDRGVDIKNDYWWMNLPYVMAIFLRKGPDKKAPKGLYSLKMDEGSSSYIVAFEDRRDATNFSYILESFFEDLGDVSADVVPLSMEEIKDALKSNTMKIVVVRKGQLHLYAGQPLGDVEMALRTVVG